MHPSKIPVAKREEGKGLNILHILLTANGIVKKMFKVTDACVFVGLV